MSGLILKKIIILVRNSSHVFSFSKHIWLIVFFLWCLLTLPVLAMSMLPKNGLSLKIKCSEENKTEEKILEFRGAYKDETFSIDYKINKNGNKETAIGKKIYSEWGYISLIPKVNHIDNTYKVVSIIETNGNFEKILSFIPGIYTGKIKFRNKDIEYIADVNIKIDTKSRVKTDFGLNYVYPIKSTVKNFDGSNGVFEVNTLFSPSFKFHLNEKTIVKTTKAESKRKCEVTSFKSLNLSPVRSFKTELPSVGSVLQYDCVGNVSKVRMTIISNKNNYASVMWTSSLGEFYWKGPTWMILFGLSEERYKKGDLKTETWKFNYNINKSDTFIKEMIEGFYYGTTKSDTQSKFNSGVYSDIFLRVFYGDVIDTTHFGKHKTYTFISETLDKNYVRNYVSRYSESLKAPVEFETYKSSKLPYEHKCRLISIKGKK